MLLCLLVVLGWVHQREFHSATPVSRLDLLYALTVDRTFAIDRYHANTPDKAEKDGHFYSDKAPGTAALALPGFALGAALVRAAGQDVESRTGWLVTSWVACFTSQALPVALGGAALCAWLGRRVRPRVALLTVLGLTLGGMAWPYSTLLFSHAQVIGLISLAIGAMWLFDDAAWEQCTATAQRWRMGGAGLCLGLALASEYTAGLVVVGLGLYVLMRRAAGRVPFLLAAIPPLLLIPWYSCVTIGTPFELPYSYQASFPAMREGLYAIKWPDFTTLRRLLVEPTRGLLFWSPFLLMACVGWCRVARERPRWLWLTYGLPVVQALVISGRTWDWEAGYTLSARYLAPIIPLLALPAALGVARYPRLGAALAVGSIGLMSLATVTDACPNVDLYNPLTQLHVPKFLRGEFSYNLGTEVLGLSPYAGVALFYTLLVAGIAWLWHLAGKEDRAGASCETPTGAAGTRECNDLASVR